MRRLDSVHLLFFLFLFSTVARVTGTGFMQLMTFFLGIPKIRPEIITIIMIIY